VALPPPQTRIRVAGEVGAFSSFPSCTWERNYDPSCAWAKQSFASNWVPKRRLGTRKNFMSSLDTLEIHRGHCTSPLCRIRIAEASNSMKGELDVFIQAARGRFFERITVQRPDRFIDYKKHIGEINACTWHGNYLISDDKILEPKIHLKSGSKKLAWTALEGVIDQENIFLFPVFSLYIPMNCSPQDYKRKTKGNHQKLLLDQEDVRIDFFLLPKEVPFEKFLKLSISAFYLTMDITIFNRQLRGVALPLDNCKLRFNFIKLKSWWSLIRFVCPQQIKIDQYWIYFHDTFDPISCILDRGYVFPSSNCIEAHNENQYQGKLLFRDRHENELMELGLKKIRPCIDKS
jgi:hypothetical protein